MGMEKEAVSLLVIAGSQSDFNALERQLGLQGLVAFCRQADSREAFAVSLQSRGWDAILFDYPVEDFDIGQCLELIQAGGPGVPVILISSSLGEEEAVEWLKRGVADFVLKDRPARLGMAIERALKEAAERRRHQSVEEALRRSRALLRLITDAAPVLIAYVDMECRYRLVNRCYERWFGLRVEDMIGKHVREVLGEAVWAVVKPYIDRVLQGEEISYEHELPYPGENPRWVQVHYTPDRDETGEVRGFVVLVQDVEGRKRIEIALEAHRTHLEDEVAARTAQLAAMNQELQAFAYAVSHDLKAPLRSINAFSGLLESRCRTCLGEDSLQFLAYIQQGVGRMNGLIDDLLSYARMEQRTLQQTSLDVPSAVKAILAEKDAEVRQSGAVVRIDMPPIMVKADPEGFAQVLRNLVDNAIKFSAKASPPVIEIGAQPVEGHVCRLWVRDNGIGFDMGQHDRIFQIFQRLHNVEEFPGTGVGLALIKKAMERMGGRVWAESTPGKGAYFYLELPKA